MPSEENPVTEEDEPALPLELQHPCDECEWIGRSEESLRGHKIMAHGYRSQIEISCPQCPRSVERNSPPSPMPEFTSSVSHVHGQSSATSDPSFTARAQSSLDPKLFVPR